MREFAERPLERSLVGIFKSQSQERPDAVAVIDGDLRVSYRDLARTAEALRRHLFAIGISPGDHVGISMGRSWRLTAAIIGVLAAGASYVPLDPRYPEKRLRHMVSDSIVSIVCVDDSDPAIAVIPGLSFIVVGPDDDYSTLDDLVAHQGGYIIYTSGSTGFPKGVPIPQGNVLELFDAVDQLFEFGPRDVWSMFHSCSFDFSVWEMWGALLHGGAILIVHESQTRDPRELLKALEREHVSVLSQVPSAFKYFVRAYERAPLPLETLRYVVFGGEALDKPSVRRWLGMRSGPEKLINMYGITETTVHVTYAVVTSDDVSDDSAPTRIGRALPHLRICLLSDGLTLVPMGESGEIFVAGTALSPGYLGRPDLEVERFPVIDLGSGPERWYRSGDLARQTGNGELMYLGRVDSQVNLRGFRIEVNEIEAVLCESDIVLDAAVTVATLPSREDILVALVTSPEEREPPSAASLREVCRERLPFYMVPDRFIVLAELPMTPSGKIDRAALPGAALRMSGSRVRTT